LQELAGIFAVSVGGFSVLDNHLHVLVRLDPDTAKSWSDEESCGAGVASFLHETNPASRWHSPGNGLNPVSRTCRGLQKLASDCKA
jgi:hypothetical protein